jgi:hypothetical protein
MTELVLNYAMSSETLPSHRNATALYFDDLICNDADHSLRTRNVSARSNAVLGSNPTKGTDV